MNAKTHEKVIQNYVGSMKFLHWLLNPSKRDKPLTPDDRLWYTRAWSLMQRAHIFEFEEKTYLGMHTAADMYVTTQIMKMSWTGIHGIDKPVPETEEDKERGPKQMMHAERVGRRMPFPDPLPFPVTYIAYGGGVLLNEIQKEARGVAQDAELTLCGHLLDAEHGIAAEVVLADNLGDGSFMGGYVGRLYDGHGSWWAQSSVNLAPWIINSFVGFINSHRTVIDETRHRNTLTDKMFWKKQTKGGIKMPIPPPYYVVHMKDEYIRDLAKKPTLFPKKIQWQHRWSVRAHDVVKFQRGTLPLDPKTADKLRKRKYKIFTVNPLDLETWKLLAERRIEPKRENEWMAVLIYRRRDFVKGPESAPFVPSVRRTAKKSKYAA